MFAQLALQCSPQVAQCTNTNSFFDCEHRFCGPRNYFVSPLAKILLLDIYVVVLSWRFCLDFVLRWSCFGWSWTFLIFFSYHFNGTIKSNMYHNTVYLYVFSSIIICLNLTFRSRFIFHEYLGCCNA